MAVGLREAGSAPGLGGVRSSSVAGDKGLGVSALAKDNVPKGSLTVSPLSFGFHSSEKTQDLMGQVAYEMCFCVLGS